MKSRAYMAIYLRQDVTSSANNRNRPVVDLRGLSLKQLKRGEDDLNDQMEIEEEEPTPLLDSNQVLFGELKLGNEVH